MRTSLALSTVLLALALVPLARSQPPTITTLAGSPGQGSADGTGVAARFANPWGVAADTNGNWYVADTDNHTIRKITAGGVVSTLAGLAGVSGSANGTGSAARFYQPQGVAVDGAGNVYVADTGNYTIRKITSAGVVTTLAGSAGTSGSTDASGGSARFYEPEGIAVNSAGTLIYVADTWNHTIRQITSAGAVTTLAGSAGNYGSANGTGSSASFDQPQGLALDGAGNLYVGDTGNQMIRKVTSAGVVTTLAGSAGTYGSTDATGSSASFWNPQGVALDASTNLYVADSFNNTIRKITPAGVVTTLAGTAGGLGSADGTGTGARFWLPQGVAVDNSGNLCVADTANGTMRKIASGAVVTTLAGSASTGNADAAGSGARFYWPSGAALDNAGNTYMADTENGTIRVVTSSGVVSTLAGSAGNFGSTDATGSNARFYGPQAVAVDSSGTLYVADTANHTIRKITSGGVVSTLAGLAGTNGLTDGTGSSARFNAPQGLAVGASGNVYVADTWNHTIRKVTSAGVVTTLAGLPGYSGDVDGTSLGGGTNTARFYCPSGVAVDAAGNLYVADTRNHTIRKVTSGGTVSTLAGLAGVWGSADGTGSSARFYEPRAITVDSSGNLYVLDAGNQTLRLVTPVGTNWVVTTIAGQATVSGSADGAGTNAQFFYPAGLGMNSAGSLVVADWGNNTLRANWVSTNAGPVITVQPQDQTANQGQNATFTVTASGSAPLSYQWLFDSAPLSGATASTYTVNNAQPGNVGSYSVIVSNSVSTETSSNALLTVIVPPAITNLPQSLSVTQGLNATFSVGASGSAPLTYQWTFDSTGISGATASSYTRVNVQTTDAGTYAVVVSNPAGSVTSTPPAVLTVIAVPTPPGISGQPQNQVVNQSSSATFTVTATGSTPLAYRWLFNGATLAGGSASSYTVANAQATNAGSYSVIVTNAYGMMTSALATLTVTLPPIISVQPSNQLAAVSNSVTFTVGLSQGTSPAYQWRQNGTALTGATQSSLTLASLTWGSAGTYSVVVSNAAGNQTSTGATLIVQQAAFTFFDGFESYQLGGLDSTTTSGPNPTSPWWGLNTSAQSSVTNANGGVTPHGGSQMAGAAGSSKQDYINLLYRMNAGQTYYGNFMCDWWFYDPYGTGTGATSSQEYLAVCQYAPVSTTSDTSSFTTYNQRMSLGVYNGSGYNYLNYQARIIGGSGNFGSGNSWYNTATVRSAGWHHARVVVGIPDPSNYAPIWMYIDNMTNAAVTSLNSTNNVGFNLIEVNHYSSTGGTGWYYDDLTFRAADDPWIIEQPVNQAVNLGQPAYFNTVAVGTAYQWQFNGTNLAGATTSAYSIAAVAVANAGSYACLITGTNGTIATTAATLTLTGPPSIVVPPGSLTVTQSQSAAFSVTAVGTTPLSCQWLFNGALLSGATATNYTVASAQATNAGSYSVVVTNILGSVTSSAAILTVLVPPTITTPPQPLTVNQGTDAPFSVTASGTTPFGYQWLFNGGPIATATASTFTVPDAQATNAGSYSVVVSNIVGNVTSAVAALTVILPPTVATPPQPLTVNQGADASFTVTADGTAPLSYQWQWNGSPLSGATATSYTVASAQAANAGSYTVVVTNLAGSVTSAVATLTVIVPPTVTTPPQSLTVNQGTNAPFTVTAGGTAPLSYQWQWNGAPLSGATATSYTVSNVQATNAGSYTVVVTNVLGGVTSAVASLTVIVPPTIITPPQSLSVNQGTNAPFSVTAGGTAPLSYQWQWNGAPISGATATTYAVASAQTTNAGSYTVVVTNVLGSVTSAVATLTVITNPPPSLAGHFDSLNLLGDGSLQLNMSGAANTNYVLEFTGDWVSWTPLTTNSSGPSGLFQFNDPSVATNSERFYRLRLAP